MQVVSKENQTQKPKIDIEYRSVMDLLNTYIY